MLQVDTKKLFLSLFYLFFFGYVGIAVIYMPKVLLETGYTHLQVGMILSAVPITRFLAPFLFLKFLSITTRLFYLALLLFLACSIFYYYALKHFFLLILLNLSIGFSLSIIIPFIEAYAISHLKENYGKVRLFGSVGFIFTAIFLSDKLGKDSNLFLFLVASVALTTLFGFLLDKDGVDKKTKEYKESSFNLLDLCYFWIMSFLVQVSFGGYYGFFTIYGEEHGFSLDTISYLWSFGVVCEILMLFFQGAILRRYSLRNLFKFALLITSIRWFLLFLFPSNLFVYAFTQSLHAISFALFHTISLNFIHQAYKNKHLAQQFYSGISYGLGSFIGSLFAGYIYGEYLFLGCSLVALLGFFVFLRQR